MLRECCSGCQIMIRKWNIKLQKGQFTMPKLYSVHIKYADDGMEMDTLICDSDGVWEERDDEIFFYGFSKDDIERIVQNKELCEGEWYITEFYGEVD